MSTIGKSKRIRLDVDEEVYAALAQQAVGFETPNQVLRRLLGLAAE